MDDNATYLKLAKFSRYLGRISAVTRVVGILIVVAAGITMLFALPELLGGHRVDDALALVLVALGIGGIGVLVWSTGVFHGAVAHALVVFGWVDGKLWEVMATLKQQSVPAQGAQAQLPATAAAIPGTVAVAASLGMVQSAEQREGSGGQEPCAPAGAQAPVPRAVPEPAVVAAPATMRCKHCGGEIPTNVLRCRYCLERV